MHFLVDIVCQCGLCDAYKVISRHSTPEAHRESRCNVKQGDKQIHDIC